MEKHSFNGPNQKPGRCHPRILRIIGVTFIGILFAALFALAFGFLVKILWNSLMPAIFGLTTISYWQAFGLVILAKLLFGSFGHHCRHNHQNHQNHIHKKVEEKWHRFLGIDDDNHDDEPGKSKRSHKNWKYYKQYWQDEGKAAFEAYIDKLETEEEK